MPKFVVRAETQHKLIDDAFAEMEKQGLMKKMQSLVSKAIYKSKLNGLFFFIRKGMSSYIFEEGKDYFVAIETGDAEYIENEKKKWEKFVFGDYESMKKEDIVNKFRNDRMIIQILNKFNHAARKSKEWALGKALGGGKVIDFFNRLGISIIWRVEVDDRDTKQDS